MRILKEDIEKHNELNPVLWNGDELKPDVKEKIDLIAEEFLNNLTEDGITIEVKDIVLIGSNCSYNYTKDSDLDIHIIAEHIDAPDNLYDKIYSSYRSLFDKKLDIEFYGIPVELFVQTEELPTVSNGIYSVMNNEWIKEPFKEDIPEIDKEALDKEVNEWENKYNEIIKAGEKKLDESEQNNYKIEKHFGVIYSGTNFSMDKFYSTPEEALDKFNDNVIYGESAELGYLNSGYFWHAYEGFDTFACKYDRINAKKQYDSGYSFFLNDIGWFNPAEQSWNEIEKIIKDFNNKQILKANNEYITWARKFHESLHEDLNDAKSIIADQVRGEWEAIQNYNKAIKDLEEINYDDFGETIDVLNSIIDEEEIHVGELEKVQATIDNNVLDNISDGREEAEEHMSEPATDLANESLANDLKESSLTHDSFETDNYYLEYRWDKNNGYEVIGGQLLSNGLVNDDFHKYFATEEAAKKYFEKCKKKLSAGEALNEALNWDEQCAKMDGWHYGTRGSSFKSMKDDKLKMNFDICVLKKYWTEATELRREGQHRGLSWAYSPKFIAAKSDGKLYYPMSTTFSKWVVDNVKVYLEGDVDAWIDGLWKAHYDDPDTVARYLVIVIVLGKPDIAVKLKDFLIECGYSVDSIKEYLNYCATNPEISKQISKILDESEFIPESLTEKVQTSQIDKIEQYIDDIYELRKNSLQEDGEYSIGNLVFKEIRNKGYLDNLKELKNQLIGKELSLESLQESETSEEIEESFDRQTYEKIRLELNQVARTQVILQDNGLFNIYNVKENTVDGILNNLRRLPYVEWVNKNAGRFDFSNVSYYGPQPRYYTITGKIREEI